MKCEYCGMEARTLHTHHQRCPDNPKVWTATRDALDAGDGSIVPAQRYKAFTQPVSDATLRKRYGSWAQVADAFGLRWHDFRKRKDGVICHPPPITDGDEIDQPLSTDEQEWARAEPEATYPLRGYKVRTVETRYVLPAPGMGLRVVHEYIALR